MKKHLVIAISVALAFTPFTTSQSNAAVINGKSSPGTTSKSATSGANAKAIAAQQALVDQLTDSVKKGTASCAALKGKDTAGMLACLAKLKAVNATLASEQAKLAALKKAAGVIKTVSTSTVNANPIGNSNDLNLALERIAALEANVRSLTSALKSNIGTLRKQTLTWIAWVPVTWSGADVYSMDMNSIKPLPGDHCSGGVIGERVQAGAIVPKNNSSTATTGWTTFTCSRIVYVP